MILIVRHLESSKNRYKQFSSYEENEALTNEGIMSGNEIGQYIAAFVKNYKFNVEKVYCANSQRACETAEIIAGYLGVDICSFDELRSNNSGLLRGKNEKEARELNPIFMEQLKLFRAGIFSSYDFINIVEREDKHDFEKRVNGCLEKIVSSDLGDLQIIVLHHSSLTAAVINFARKFYNYPEEFYGHVACELGNIYLINNSEILLCNEPAIALKTVKIL